MKRYFVLQDWQDNFWFKGSDPLHQKNEEWTNDLFKATVFSEEQMGQYIQMRGECWQELPQLPKDKDNS